MSFGNVKLRPSDKAFSQWIRLRDGKCLRCRIPVELNDKGMPVTLQASHFQGRRKESTRFDPENVCALCAGCHSYMGANPAEHYLWQVQRLGQDVVDAIVLRSNMRGSRDDKLELIKWKTALKTL